ncbi:MAG: hypothetical protein ACK4ZJ_17235, partial [Allorhizobium sp.]
AVEHGQRLAAISKARDTTTRPALDWLSDAVPANEARTEDGAEPRDAAPPPPPPPPPPLPLPPAQLPLRSHTPVPPTQPPTHGERNDSWRAWYERRLLEGKPLMLSGACAYCCCCCCCCCCHSRRTLQLAAAPAPASRLHSSVAPRCPRRHRHRLCAPCDSLPLPSRL